MVSFWLIVSVMIVLPLIILLRTLLFQKSGKPGQYEHSNVTIYKARTAELESEIENEVLMDEQLSAVRDDLKRTLLHEEDKQLPNNSDAPQTIRRDWWTAVILTILLPVTAISVYLILSTSGFESLSRINSPDENLESLQSIEEMVEGLATKLEQEPDDQQGWFMLARSYMVLGKYNEAVSAFEKLYDLAGEHPSVLLGYANALALANNGQVTGKPEQLALKVLGMEPRNGNGLWIVGMAALERGEYQLAIDYWQQLLEQLSKDSPTYIEVEKLIALAQQQPGETGNSSDLLVSDQTSADKVTKSISVNVSLSEHLLLDTAPTDTLFIFARALEGPPMPIAVIKKQVGDLPVTVVLDDSAAMMEQRKLSGFDKVIVGARISRTGEALPQQGDLTGTNITVDMMEIDSVDILIDQKLP